MYSMIKWCPLRQIIDTHRRKYLWNGHHWGGGGKEGLFVLRLNLPDPPIELFDNLVISPHRRLTGSYFYISPPLYSATATTELLSVSPRKPSEPPKKSPSLPHPRAKKMTGLLAKVFLEWKKTRENF